jgi:hypothetical protein
MSYEFTFLSDKGKKVGKLGKNMWLIASTFDKKKAEGGTNTRAETAHRLSTGSDCDVSLTYSLGSHR